MSAAAAGDEQRSAVEDALTLHLLDPEHQEGQPGAVRLDLAELPDALR